LLFFNFRFFASYRSDIESCNLDRESSFELDDLIIEFENFRRSNSIFVKCNDAVRRTVVVICGCLTGVNNSSDRLTIVDKLLKKYIIYFEKIN
jgi:hypothetical protein